MAFIVVGTAELISFVSLEFILSPLGAAYLPAPLGEDQFRVYMTERHPILGWPKISAIRENKGLNSRRSLVNSKFKNSCVSLYGDSFTFSEGVSDRHTWAETAATELRCKVRNFGVGGYGSDQAYLRFVQQKDRDPSKIIVLNHLSENILRNVNQFRSLLYPGKANDFKPVFHASGDGGFKLTKLPEFKSYRQYLRTVRNPSLSLKREAFLPGGNNRGSQISFPYTRSFVSVLGNDFHIRAKLKGVPRHLEFYTANHPSNGLDVTLEILTRFHADVKTLNKFPVIAITPLCDDFRYFINYGRWAYQPLVEGLRRRGINVLNFGAGMMRIIGAGAPEAMYDDCSGHPNEKGYRIMGNIFAQFVKKHIATLP